MSILIFVFIVIEIHILASSYFNFNINSKTEKISEITKNLFVYTSVPPMCTTIKKK